MIYKLLIIEYNLFSEHSILDLWNTIVSFLHYNSVIFQVLLDSQMRQIRADDQYRDGTSKSRVASSIKILFFIDNLNILLDFFGKHFYPKQDMNIEQQQRNEQQRWWCLLCSTRITQGSIFSNFQTKLDWRVYIQNSTKLKNCIKLQKFIILKNCSLSEWGIAFRI